jgi:hypothetical protein
MTVVSVGQGGKYDDNDASEKADKTMTKTFGEEGTNKTQFVPDPKVKSSDVAGSGKHIQYSPFTR